VAVVGIPYDGVDPKKYLYRMFLQLYEMKIDVVVVDKGFNIYPPWVKRIKQKHPNVGGARYDFFSYALREGYDCMINADSHLIFSGDLHELCKTNTFSSTYHHPWIEKPIPMTFPVRIYASFIYSDGEKIYWCTLLQKPPYLPMTSEPLYAIKARVAEQILHKYLEYSSYGLDNVALYWSRKEGEIIDTIHYYHLGIVDRGKPLKRKPRDEEAAKFLQEYPMFHTKVQPLLELRPRCWQLWP